MSDDESDEFAKPTDNEPGGDCWVDEERRCRNIVFGDCGGGNNVLVDQTTDKEAVGKVKRIDRVKRGRAAAKKHPKRKRENRIRSRTFVGTLNNPTASDKQYYKTVALDEMTWIVAEEERAPDTGTMHLQMACHFKSPTDIAKARRVFGLNRAHIEIMKGTCEQSYQYCTKDKDNTEYIIERGVRPADKGKESKMKLAAIVAAIKEGASDRTIFEANPSMYLRYKL